MMKTLHYSIIVMAGIAMVGILYLTPSFADSVDSDGGLHS